MKKTPHAPDYFLIVLIFILLIIGLIFLASASWVMGYKNFQDPDYYLKHQIFYGLLPGLLFFFIFALIRYQFWRKLSLLSLIFSIVLLLAVFIPGLGIKGQAHRWLNLRVFSFQPIEVLKLSLILFLAYFFEKKEATIKNFSSTFLPFIFILGLISFLIIKQPNFSGLMIVLLISLSIYFVAGANLIYLFLVFCLLAIFSPLFLKFFPYLKNRLLTFISPGLEPQGISYHLQQALIAIGSGGLFGRGLGRSGQKFFYLPEVFGDSIFAVMAEELGFVLTSLVVVLFFLLIWRGLKIAKNAPDLFSRLVGVGIVSWFGFQTFINIGAMLKLLPLTGVPLPLISYGGSALIANLAAFGILVNISKKTQEL
ncbi:MAG: putative lipid II flippase FtsW [Patescibacteria group bacterium]|nr:putative lipid II flippase FtsW [Patescibacteria group bacterium]